MEGKGEAKSQEINNLAGDLQQNSQSLLALAEELGGKQGSNVLEVGEYIGKIAKKCNKVTYQRKKNYNKHKEN